MNYIKEMNAFNVWITLHPEVSSSAQLLWYVLMHYNNTCSWKKQFSVPMSMLMISTRLSESSVKRARLALLRIRYCVRPGKKATVYEMISMKEEGIVTSFLSGNGTAIAVDMSDSKDQNISQNKGQRMPKTEDKKDGLGELLPERPAERLPERILKLNKTKLNISKESTKKGSEAILEQPQENTFENAELQEVKLCPVNSFGKRKRATHDGDRSFARLVCRGTSSPLRYVFQLHSKGKPCHGNTT
ncbi:hypothetical protein [Veillonella magna]|uniref:hypothetical protein n=1 Tax=Veillonella magna TaxID=464322 RepID=UPI0023F3EA2F|nr:hypothetical protein [Veillonella magna]